MDQESIKTPQSLPPQKEEQWKDIISIIFLIALPFVGLILMWLLASWSKKTKVVITLVITIIPVIIIVSIIGTTMVAVDQVRDSAEDVKDVTRDIIRRNDMGIISALQEEYRIRNNQYYSSINYPLVILTHAEIPIEMSIEMPVDPTTKNPYGWIDNTMNPQKFCAYAALEETGWITASHRGVNECTDAKPTLNDCCFP